MANQRDKKKRLKCFGIPVDVCVKYERLAGVKVNEEPTLSQKNSVTKMMVAALNVGVASVELTAEDHEQIAQEIRENENRR